MDYCLYLQTVFRQYERDIALVTLNISANPALNAFILTCLKVTFDNLKPGNQMGLSHPTCQHYRYRNLLVASASQPSCNLLSQRVCPADRNYVDNVLIPLLEGVIPVWIF